MMIPEHFLSGFFDISTVRKHSDSGIFSEEPYEVLRYHCFMPIFPLVPFDVNIVSHLTLLLRKGSH